MYYNRFPFLIKSSASGYDADAQAYFTNANITDATAKGHYNTFVVSAKANGYYSKLHVFRPYLTSDATKNSYNAINTALYQMSYFGTVTHSATTGITGDGSTGYAGYAIDGSPYDIGGDDLGFCAGVWIKTVGSTTIDAYIIDDTVAAVGILDSSTPDSYAFLGSENYQTASRLSTGFHLLNTHPTDDTAFQVNGSEIYSGAYTYTNAFEAIYLFNYFRRYHPYHLPRYHLL